MALSINIKLSVQKFLYTVHSIYKLMTSQVGTISALQGQITALSLHTSQQLLIRHSHTHTGVGLSS